MSTCTVGLILDTGFSDNKQIVALLIAGYAVRIQRCVARGFGLTTSCAELAEALDAIGNCVVLEEATIGDP